LYVSAVAVVPLRCISWHITWNKWTSAMSSCRETVQGDSEKLLHNNARHSNAVTKNCLIAISSNGSCPVILGIYRPYILVAFKEFEKIRKWCWNKNIGSTEKWPWNTRQSLRFIKNAKDNFNSIILSKSKLSLTICTKFMTIFLIQKDSFSCSLFSPGKPHSRKKKKKSKYLKIKSQSLY
jgi:hypothetical protein